MSNDKLVSWSINPVPMRDPQYFCVFTDTAPNIEHIALVGGRGAVGGEAMRANARLISAAPDMHEACCVALDRLTAANRDEDAPVRTLLKLAIQKADRP